MQDRSGDPLLIYAAMPAVLGLKKKLSDAVLEKVRFVPIKNSSRRPALLCWVDMLRGAFRLVAESVQSRLEIDEGRVMRFVLTPTIKLPEASSAFDPWTGSLFTGKFFSAHREIGEADSPADGPGIEGWEAYVEA